MDRGFVHDLRRALNHLYDPDFLGRSPLCEAFGTTTGYDRTVRLQRILEGAIATLKPKPREPANGRQWHIYELLAYRYLQRFTQKQVADQLNISLSQLARDQTTALQALALHLWDEYHLADRVAGKAEAATGPQRRQPNSNGMNDLGWLALPSLDKVTDAVQVLQDVVAMIQPLLARYRTTVDIGVQEGLPALSVHPVALRQILLDVLTAILRLTENGHMAITANTLRLDVVFLVSGTCKNPLSGSTASDLASGLKTTRRIVELSGGSLAFETAGAIITARLTLPSLENVPVLVIDDSADHIELLRRYTANTCYRLYNTQVPERAGEIAEKTGARVIVVDIMMPTIDGWTVVQSLRAHQATSHLPIVICSIIPCEELALSLGANAFLQKPVNREGFLLALSRYLDPQQSRHR